MFLLFTVSIVVLSVAQRGRGDYVITDARQIPSLNPNEKAALGQILSSLGKDVEITVIEQPKPQPLQNFHHQQMLYGYPNQGRPFVSNYNRPQLDIIEIYSTDPRYGNNLQRPGLPPRGQYSPMYPHERDHSQFERFPGSLERYPYERYPVSTERYPSIPPSRKQRPPEHEDFPPPNPDHHHHKEQHHHQEHHHHHHHDSHRKPIEHNNSRRPPPPRPVFDEDDPRFDENEYNGDMKDSSEQSQKIVYPGSKIRDRPPHQHNINLSEIRDKDVGDSNGKDKEKYNVAGYINDFPVIFVKKEEIRR